jgi:ABC-type branched-subunit amino acid transport system substrate-binding protein
MLFVAKRSFFPDTTQHITSLQMSPLTLHRRKLLGAAASAAIGAVAPVWAQGSGSAGALRSPTLVQIADMSAGQIDVSKDFMVGMRSAWQDINARGGLRGKTMGLQTFEVDGTGNSLRNAFDFLRSQPNVLAVVGSVGDKVAASMVDILRREMPDMAHVAPWLQNFKSETADNTFAIFASRREQIVYAVKSLSSMTVTEIGAVYASAAEFANYKDEVDAVAGLLKLRVTTYGPSADLTQLGNSLGATSPRILLFLGGTPELLQFSQGIDKQAMQRYIVAMADVNLNVLQQMGLSRHAQVIATQVVPMVNSSLAVVRAYRETLGRLYDEPPTPHSLSGYIAARYTYEVLHSMDAPINRANTLLAFQRRNIMDLGGLRVDPGQRRSGNAFVTQSMIAADGRIVG